MSSTKVPRPVASFTLSTRRSERPTLFRSAMVRLEDSMAARRWQASAWGDCHRLDSPGVRSDHEEPVIEKAMAGQARVRTALSTLLLLLTAVLPASGQVVATLSIVDSAGDV